MLSTTTHPLRLWSWMLLWRWDMTSGTTCAHGSGGDLHTHNAQQGIPVIYTRAIAANNLWRPTPSLEALRHWECSTIMEMWTKKSGLIPNSHSLYQSNLDRQTFELVVNIPAWYVPSKRVSLNLRHKYHSFSLRTRGITQMIPHCCTIRRNPDTSHEVTPQGKTVADSNISE